MEYIIPLANTSVIETLIVGLNIDDETPVIIHESNDFELHLEILTEQRAFEILGFNFEVFHDEDGTHSYINYSEKYEKGVHPSLYNYKSHEYFLDILSNSVFVLKFVGKNDLHPSDISKKLIELISLIYFRSSTGIWLNTAHSANYYVDEVTIHNFLHSIQSRYQYKLNTENSITSNCFIEIDRVIQLSQSKDFNAKLTKTPKYLTVLNEIFFNSSRSIRGALAVSFLESIFVGEAKETVSGLFKNKLSSHFSKYSKTYFAKLYDARSRVFHSLKLDAFKLEEVQELQDLCCQTIIDILSGKIEPDNNGKFEAFGKELDNSMLAPSAPPPR